MKKILLIALLLIVGCVPPRLVEKDGLWYAPKTDIPYSGKWTWWYDNGQKWSEGTFKDGKWISKCWDEDGNEMDCPPAEEVE